MTACFMPSEPDVIVNLTKISPTHAKAQALGQLESFDQATLLTLANQSLGDPLAKCHLWAEDQGTYLTQNKLCEALSCETQSVLVVDVRDEDAIGGCVRGAIQLPDATLATAEGLVHLAHKALELGDEGMIVFHCMESLRRGPRCAKRLTQYLGAIQSRFNIELNKPQIKVLAGGADQWMRNFWQQQEFVENFDDDYWGFTELELCQTLSNTTHKLYDTPNDGLSPEKPTTAYSLK